MDGIKEEIFETFESCDDPMEVNQTLSISMEERNPWVSKDLREFVFYHCPECEFQSPMENQFYQHAVNTHEKAKEVFEEPEYCEPLLEDNVYRNPSSNSVHTLAQSNKNLTVLEETSADLVAEEYAELHMEPLYHNSIERAEKFIEELYTQKVKLKCPLCDEKLNSRVNFDLHQAAVHRWTLFETKPSCVKSETKKKEVLKISKENGRFSCPFKCGLHFKDEQTLKSHLVYDLDTMCIKACKGSKARKNKPEPRKYTCLTCDKDFRLFNKLKIHMKMKHGGINCRYCGNAYGTIEGLKKHLYKHHGHGDPPVHKKSVICEHCGKSVASNHIKNHVDNYHTEGEWMCEECGESFRYKSLLASHKSKQHPTLNCNLCNKQFKCGSNLNDHKRRAHQDNSKRFCEFCRKMFANGAELFKHFTDSHPGMDCPAKLGVEFFQCENCHKILASAEALYTHYKLTHKIIYKGLDLLRMCDKVSTKCPECQQISNSYMECVNHYLDNHGPDLDKELKNQGNKDRLLYCQSCDFKTRLTKSYVNHRKLH